jgi:hypothetical protein
VSFLAPGFLMAAAAAAVSMVVLHLIVTRRPRAVSLPTARFVPDVPVTSRSRSVQLSDLLLLAVRVLTILFAGAALARSVFAPHRERVVRVIVADVSGSPASRIEVRDSVRTLFRPGDAVVAFDTTARVIESPDSIGIRASATPRDPGSISAGLVAALHAATVVRDGADSVELVIVSPITTQERDRATDSIRAEWPGRARLVAVAAASTIHGSVPRILTTEDSDSSARPPFAVARNRIDTVGAVIAGANVMIASFERRWRFTTDSLRHSRVVARWVDGEPAAIERDSGPGCVRSVAVPFDSSGDMLLRPDVIRFSASLRTACGTTASVRDTATARMLTVPGRLAGTADFPPASDVDSLLARWLAGIAIALAIIEMVLRQTRAPELER